MMSAGALLPAGTVTTGVVANGVATVTATTTVGRGATATTAVATAVVTTTTTIVGVVVTTTAVRGTARRDAKGMRAGRRRMWRRGLGAGAASLSVRAVPVLESEEAEIRMVTGRGRGRSAMPSDSKAAGPRPARPAQAQVVTVTLTEPVGHDGNLKPFAPVELEGSTRRADSAAQGVCLRLILSDSNLREISQSPQVDSTECCQCH